MTARGPKIADWVWKGVYLEVLGRSRQFFLNKFFDSITTEEEKKRGGNVGKNGGRGEKNDENSGQ